MRCNECPWFSKEKVSPYDDDPLVNKCNSADNYFPPEDRFYSDPDTPEWCPLRRMK